jgi:hypothetical protein
MQFSYKHHIPVDINTSDALHVITRRGKNDDYDWLDQHSTYVLQWDARRNETFTEMHSMITDEEYMIWYMSIIRRIITLDPE